MQFFGYGGHTRKSDNLSHFGYSLRAFILFHIGEVRDCYLVFGKAHSITTVMDTLWGSYDNS